MSGGSDCGGTMDNYWAKILGAVRDGIAACLARNCSLPGRVCLYWCELSEPGNSLPLF